MILLISFVGYLQIQDPRAKLAEVELDHWSYNEQQSAVQISSHEYKQASTRRSLLKNSNVHRYMLSLSYWEQLTMAVRNLFSLTCFGNVWNMSVVQPFTYNSRLYGLPNLKPGESIAIASGFVCLVVELLLELFALLNSVVGCGIHAETLLKILHFNK